MTLEEYKKLFSQIDQADANQVMGLFHELKAQDDQVAYEAGTWMIQVSDQVFVWWLFAEWLATKLYVPALPVLIERARNMPAPTRPALRDYRQVIRAAISRLTGVKNGDHCGCGSRKSTPAAETNIVVDSEKVNRDAYETVYRCHCQACGKKWKVTESAGYHYPVFRWVPTA